MDPIILSSDIVIYLAHLPFKDHISIACTPFIAGAKLWVLHIHSWGAVVQQGETAEQWRQVGGGHRGEHQSGLPVPLT